MFFLMFLHNMLTNQEYREFDLSVLIDMLADQTVKYTRALVRGESGQTLDYYRSNINLLSTEIKFRKAVGHPAAGVAVISNQQQSAT
jgi:hypothetical protein